MQRFSSVAAVVEEAITPSVQINHTKLFINGQFVDSASGSHHLSYCIIQELDFLHMNLISNPLFRKNIPHVGSPDWRNHCARC